MKKTVIALLLIVLCFHLSAQASLFIEEDFLTPPDVQQSDAALLIDMNSGRLLYGKNVDKRIFPASTTKMMTGILAIEMGNHDDIVSANAEALAPITIYDSQMGLMVGERLSLIQLINALLIPSANDAANVIAVHVAGSMDKFVELMNSKAKELGMKNTHFTNTCGMHYENHYTTAKDLSLLAQYAMKNETFRNIVKTAVYKIPPTNKCENERILTNTNLFLSSSFHRNPLCTGIKTGHTSKAGYCLVSSAESEGMYLLSVVMGCENEDLQSKAYSYINSKSLFDFGFNNYINKIVATQGDIVYSSKVYEAKGRKMAELTVDTQVNALVPVKNSSEVEATFNLPEQINAPVAKGSVLGTVTYSYKGNVIAVTNLVATDDVERSSILHIIHIAGKIMFNPFFIAFVIIVLLIINNNKRKKRRQRRRQMFKDDYIKETDNYKIYK